MIMWNKLSVIEENRTIKSMHCVEKDRFEELNKFIA